MKGTFQPGPFASWKVFFIFFNLYFEKISSLNPGDDEDYTIVVFVNQCSENFSEYLVELATKTLSSVAAPPDGFMCGYITTIGGHLSE